MMAVVSPRPPVVTVPSPGGLSGQFGVKSSRMLRVSCLCFPKVEYQDRKHVARHEHRHGDTGDQIHDLLCFIVFPSQYYSCCVQ